MVSATKAITCARDELGINKSSIQGQAEKPNGCCPLMASKTNALNYAGNKFSNQKSSTLEIPKCLIAVIP